MTFAPDPRSTDPLTPPVPEKGDSWQEDTWAKQRVFGAGGPCDVSRSADFKVASLGFVPNPAGGQIYG